MKLSEIKALPTIREVSCLSERQSFHESVLRSYHIVSKVKEWLILDVPAPAILELIEYLEE